MNFWDCCIKKLNNRGGMRLEVGFTLVEILVVIMILMILVIVVLANYNGAQRLARLNFAADSLVSVIEGQKVLARSGKRSSGSEGEASLYCYGVLIEEDGVKTQEMKYVALDDSADVEAGAGGAFGRADECMVERNAWRGQESVIAEGMEVSWTGVPSSLDEVVLVFKPPFGRVDFENSFGFLGDVQVREEVIISLKYEGGEQERRVLIAPRTGEVRRVVGE